MKLQLKRKTAIDAGGKVWSTKPLKSGNTALLTSTDTNLGITWAKEAQKGKTVSQDCRRFPTNLFRDEISEGLNRSPVITRAGWLSPTRIKGKILQPFCYSATSHCYPTFHCRKSNLFFSNSRIILRRKILPPGEERWAFCHQCRMTALNVTL